MGVNIRKWGDECVLASKGVLLATREKRFYAGFLPSFIIFSLLMNLLSNGFATFELMTASGFGGACKILFDAFLGVFGVGKNFLEWLPIFAIATMQSILIGLIVLIWQKKQIGVNANMRANANANASDASRNAGVHANARTRVRANANVNARVKANADANGNAANVQKAGIITGLIALGAGCPTCGTTLITPLIGTFVSTGSLAVAGAISTVVTWLAIIIALFALKRLGLETYVIIINEKYLKKRGVDGRAQSVKI